jgi:hypothetical protein
MTTTAHPHHDVLTPARQVSPLSDTDRTYDLSETCARCGPRTQAQFKWVFPQISELTKEHRDLYLCAHCSHLGKRRLLATSILHVDRT